MLTQILSTRTLALASVLAIAMSCWSFVPAARRARADEPNKAQKYALLVGVREYKTPAAAQREVLGARH